MKTDFGYCLDLGGGVELDLLVTAEGELLGIGEVRAAGVPLRSAAVPLRPLLRSVDGTEYAHFRFGGIEARGDGGYDVHTVALGEPLGLTAYGDEYNEAQIRVCATDQLAEDELVWLLRPEELTLGDCRYYGFSYAWRLHAERERFYRVVTRATWEPGGRASGNTVLSQGQVTPPVYTASIENRFTSACLKRLTSFDQAQGMSYQLTPRYGIHQCFDFVANENGWLLGYWPGRADVRSFTQKNADEDVIFFVDAAYFATTSQVETERKCVLYCAARQQNLDDAEMRNRWKDALDYCGDLIRADFGVRKTRPWPAATVSYDSREGASGEFEMRAGGNWVPPRDWLRGVADDQLPELAARGMKRVIPHPVNETDVSERGGLRKRDFGIHGDLNVGSVCCAHRYRPAEFWGGWEAWRYFYEKARGLGMEVGIWIGPHLATEAPILKEHPEWVSRGFNTAVNSGGYPDGVLSVLNWNTGARQWILDDLRRWKEEGGLDYIFFDSFPNLGLFPLDYNREMQSSHAAVCEFVADLQSIGIEGIEIEGMGPLGVSAAGVLDPFTGPTRDSREIAGQNSWDWYIGNEDMMCDQTPRVELHPDRDPEQARQIWFRCLANHCVPMLGRYSHGYAPNPTWFKEYLDLYMEFEAMLIKRRLLPGRRGVLWQGGAADIVWSFEAGDLSVPDTARVRCLNAGGATVKPVGGRLQLQPWSVYQIER